MTWRSTLVGIPLFIAILAGCASSDVLTIDDEFPLPPVASLPVFSAPVVVGAGSEPGLLLTNGTIWAHAPGQMWRSNNGTFWSEVSPGAALGVFGNDAEMAQGSDGTLYYSDLQLLTSISVYTSTDNGVTWNYFPVASLVPVVDRQWMATGPDVGPLAGAHHAAYLAFNNLASSPWVTKSTDGGQTWTGRLVDPTQTQQDFWSIGNIVVDPKDGAIYLAWSLGNAAQGIGPEPPTVDYRIRMVKSMDGGLTWTASTILDPAGNVGYLFPVLALDDVGNLFLTWSEDMGGHQEIRLMSSNDKGSTWSTPVRVNQHNGTAIMPWIDASGDGHVAIAWYGNNATALSDNAAGDWFVYMAQSMDANGTAPTFSEVKVREESIRNGAICTLGIACTGNRELADFFQVRLDEAGNAHVVFASTEDGDGTQTLYARQIAGPTL